MKTGDQRIDEGQDIDHRKLRIGIPAEEDQRDREEGDAEDIEALGVLHRIGLEEEHARQHDQHGAEHDDLQLGIAPDALPEIGLRRALFLRRGDALDDEGQLGLENVGAQRVVAYGIDEVAGDARLLGDALVAALWKVKDMFKL